MAIYSSRERVSEKKVWTRMVCSRSSKACSLVDIRLAQVQRLLEAGFLSVSVDYRPSPDVSVCEGPNSHGHGPNLLT
jgi:hypothetical protein